MVATLGGVRIRTALLASGAVGALLLLTACSGGDSAEPASSASGSAAASAASRQTLLDQQQLTVLDQPIAYPKKKPAQITSTILQLEPGQETGWHKHNTPLYVYVLEGTVSVEYDAGVTKEYAAGTALMEAQGVWHNGTNKGDQPVRLLTVNLGAKGVKNSVDRAP